VNNDMNMNNNFAKLTILLVAMSVARRASKTRRLSACSLEKQAQIDEGCICLDQNRNLIKESASVLGSYPLHHQPVSRI